MFRDTCPGRPIREICRPWLPPRTPTVPRPRTPARTVELPLDTTLIQFHASPAANGGQALLNSPPIAPNSAITQLVLTGEHDPDNINEHTWLAQLRAAAEPAITNAHFDQARELWLTEGGSAQIIAWTTLLLPNLWIPIPPELPILTCRFTNKQSVSLDVILYVTVVTIPSP